MTYNETPKTEIETVYRYRILRHTEYTEDRKAELRLSGINPDDQWSLVWSFPFFDDALEQLNHERTEGLFSDPTVYTWRLAAAGEAP